MVEKLDWFSSTIDTAARLRDTPNLAAVENAFSVLEQHLLKQTHTQEDTRDKFCTVLKVYAAQKHTAHDFESFLAAAIDVYKFIYSVLRDEAYERKSIQMLANLNHVHLTHLLKFKEKMAEVFGSKVPKSTEDRLMRALYEATASHQVSLNTMQQFISGPITPIPLFPHDRGKKVEKKKSA